MGEETALMSAISWALDVDAPSVSASVAALRAKHPTEDHEALAWRIFKKAGWQATAAGVATGMPTNPWVAFPAAVADVALVLRMEVAAAARVAVLYDPTFLDDDDAVYELLVPVFGLNFASQAAREMGVRGGMGVTRNLVKTYLSKGTLKQFQKIMLKYFGLKVTQKAVLTKTLPVIGGMIGGAWNWVEVRALGHRCVNYFSGQSLGET